MDWKWPACLLVVVSGVVLFLYGANYYSSVAGWAGLYLFIGGIFAYVLLRVFLSPVKVGSDQKS